VVERRLTPRAAVAAAIALAGCATAPVPAGTPPGYLTPAALDRLAALTPPPLDSVPPWRAGLVDAVPAGTDRWWLATAHAELRSPWAAQHFDCVLGTRLLERPRPALNRAMARLGADAAALARRGLVLSESAPRRRPVAAIEGLEPCERVPDAVRDGPASPATGAVLAGAYGELFAALAPDAAGPARSLAREIGYSRVVCRMNWPPDVEAGLALGVGLYRQAESEPAFRADFEAARGELAAARAEGLTSPACAAERRALAQWRAPPPGQAGRGPTSEP